MPKKMQTTLKMHRFFTKEAPKATPKLSINKLKDTFKIDLDLLPILDIDGKKLLKLLQRLDRLNKGTLFPFTTQLFLKKIGYNSLLLVTAANQEKSVSNILSTGRYNKEEIYSLYLLSIFFKADKVRAYLEATYNFSTGIDALNLAILSNKYTIETIEPFTKEIKPTYDSIRFAVLSGNVATVRFLAEQYGLKPNSDHLIAAISLPTTDMYHTLLELGAEPTGDLIHEIAEETNNEEIMALLSSAPKHGRAIS